MNIYIYFFSPPTLIAQRSDMQRILHAIRIHVGHQGVASIMSHSVASQPEEQYSIGKPTPGRQMLRRNAPIYFNLNVERAPASGCDNNEDPKRQPDQRHVPATRAIPNTIKTQMLLSVIVLRMPTTAARKTVRKILHLQAQSAVPALHQT